MSIDRRILMAIAAPVILGAPLLLGGCQHGTEEAMNLDPTWGEANRQTMAAQIVNPEPDYSWEEMETSAAHSSDAIERYRKGAVKQPESISTTSGLGGSDSN